MISAHMSRWLLHGGAADAPGIHRSLTKRLHQTPSIFGGGGMSTVAVAVILAIYLGTTVAVLWAISESLLMICRGIILWRGRQRTNNTFVERSDAFLVVEFLGAVSVGFGTVISVLSGNWQAVAAGWMSVAAFAGEACMVNFGTPRLLTAMVIVGTVPTVVACLITGQPALIVGAMLTGLYLGRMLLSSYQINTLLIATVRAERENDHRARHDKLTGLLNRAGLEREFDLLRSEFPRSDIALFFIDLDRFKQVNDQHGHAVGDQVLRLVSEHLLDLSAPHDVVARIGGDEFVIITALDLVQPAEFGAAVLFAVAEVNRKIALHGCQVSASVGLTRSNVNRTSLPALLAAADEALYHAKHHGGAQCA